MDDVRLTGKISYRPITLGPPREMSGVLTMTGGFVVTAPEHGGTPLSIPIFRVYLSDYNDTPWFCFIRNAVLRAHQVMGDDTGLVARVFGVNIPEGWIEATLRDYATKDNLLPPSIPGILGANNRLRISIGMY